MLLSLLEKIMALFFDKEAKLFLYFNFLYRKMNAHNLYYT